MNFSTVTRSGVFQYVQKDTSNIIAIADVEQLCIDKFNKMYMNKGIQLEKFCEHIPFAFTIKAESRYSSTDNVREIHPSYSDIILSTGGLNSIADGFHLKCTRRGT